MSYTATWTNGLGGRLRGAIDRVRLSDPQELLAAVNRRRLLAYMQEIAPGIIPGQPVSKLTLGTLRQSLSETLLAPPEGTIGGPPPTPGQMRWIWPLGDADAGKTIVSGSGGVGAGEVGLFQRLNGTGAWTDPDVTGRHVRAIHWDELRQAVEWLCRGRWRLPVYFWGGMFSTIPDIPWMPEIVALDEQSEMRTTGTAMLQSIRGGKVVGPFDVTCLSTSRIEITTDADCQLEIYRCLRAVDFVNDPPTWNDYAPNTPLAWQQGGGLGAQDAQSIGTLIATGGQPAALTGQGVAAVLQSMIDGAVCGFTVRRVDAGPETVQVTAELVVEFELTSPPN